MERKEHVERITAPLYALRIAIQVVSVPLVERNAASTVLRHVPPVAECPAPKVHVQLYVKMHVTPNAPLVHSIVVILVLIIVRELAAIVVMISAPTIVICSVS